MGACDFLTGDGGESIPITPLGKQDLASLLEGFASIASWVRATGFSADPGTHCVIPAAHGGIGRVLLGVGDEPMWDWATLPDKLPATVYHIDAAPPPSAAADAAFGWTLATYRFERYRKRRGSLATLRWPDAADRAAVQSAAEATFLVRDLINTPASDMGPAELAAAVRLVAEQFGACCSVIEGDESDHPRLSCGTRRGPRQCPGAAAARFDLGRRVVAEDHAGRQGRVLRLRWARHQACRRDEANEEGHARRRDHARTRPDGDGCEPADAAAAADSGCRKRHLGRCRAPSRRGPYASGPHRGDRQYRRRGPGDPRRRVGRGGDGEAGAAPRLRHADGGRAGGARHRAAGAVQQRGCARRELFWRTAEHVATRCGECRCGKPTPGISRERRPI